MPALSSFIHADVVALGDEGGLSPHPRHSSVLPTALWPAARPNRTGNHRGLDRLAKAGCIACAMVGWYDPSPMAKRTTSTESLTHGSQDVDRLTQAVAVLTDQVRNLSLILDEIRDELVWAVRNDRFNAIPISMTWTPTASASPPPQDNAQVVHPLSSPPAQAIGKGSLFD